MRLRDYYCAKKEREKKDLDEVCSRLQQLKTEPDDDEEQEADSAVDLYQDEQSNEYRYIRP